MSERVRVLHVIESYGGGSATALAQHVRSTPEVSHHLLRRVRPGSYASNGEEELFDSLRDLGPGHPRAVRAVRAAVRELRPDVVHAHSSIAGVYVRVGVWGRATVAYTPHGYAVERLDVSPFERAFFWAAEALLALNTDVYLGCSRRETAIGRRLAPYRRHVTVPNVARVQRRSVPDRTGPPRSARPVPLVCGMGRMGPQHSPEFFADVVRRMRAERPDVEARWIGGGDEADVARLAAAGVDVTGWVTQDEVFATLREASVYVHSAAWDGAPMALLEASALGVPIVARRTKALAECPAGYLAATADGVATAALGVLREEQAASNVDAWARAYAENSPPVQHDRLLSAYRPRRAG